MIDRRVRVLDAGGKGADAGVLTRRFSEFATVPNIVLLGDPGAGKTVLFEEAARTGAGQYCKARMFGLLPPAELGDALFIDALDEQRAGSVDENSPVDEIVKKLFERRPTRVRISCREQDWLGETDLAAFATYFNCNGATIVLRLEPTDRDEQIEILIADGAVSAEAAAFIEEAERRGMDRFLRNPRKMLMLWRVVGTGIWPQSTSELFQRATDLQLTEENTDHARTGDGQYSAGELRLPAGGICAARLISDVQGICLGPIDAGSRYPNYRTLTYLDAARVRAALRRPLFVTSGPAECVDYDHRTSAEFLAAEWLADRVRNKALPIDRLQSLMGSGGHPAAELRGLNAWLASALPEHAGIFIAADPLGVLEYGDAASLKSSMREALLTALADTAKLNPWFLGPNHIPAGIEHLVQPDSVASLCAILDASDQPRDLRTLALEAFAAAAPQQAAFETLLHVFCDNSTRWGERYRALDCLHAFGDAGRKAILAALPDLAGKTEDVIRLRGRCVDFYYGAGLDANNVVALFCDVLYRAPDTSIGLLWKLADALPLQDVPNIVDAIAVTVTESCTEEFRRPAWDAGSFVNRMMSRVSTEAPEALSGARILVWTELRHRLKRLGSDDSDDNFIKDIRTHPALTRAVFEAFIDQSVPESEKPGRLLRAFYETVAPFATEEDLCDWGLERTRHETDRDRRHFVFGLSAQLSLRDGSRARAQFERIVALSQSEPALAAVLAPYLFCKIEGWQFEDCERKNQHNREHREGKAKLRADFAMQRELVRSGNSDLVHLAAAIYFDLFSDLAHDSEPAARLADYLGEEDAEAALDGIRSFVRPDRAPPSFDEIVNQISKGHYIIWWRTLAAGVDVLVRAGDVAAVPEATAGAMLLFDLFEHLSDRLKRGDEANSASVPEALMRQYPDAAIAAYQRAVEFELGLGKEHSSALHSYVNEEFFRRARRGSLISLLERFPNARPRTLELLLGATLAERDLHGSLQTLAARFLADNAIGAEQRQLWLVAAYMLQPSRLQDAVRARIAADPNLVWPLRDFLGYESRTAYGAWLLTPGDLAFLITELGAVWPPVEYPSSGWSGDSNSWDATHCLRKLISKLSSISTLDATFALEALVAEPRLAQYENHLKYALAQQRILRREAEYDRPDWSSTVNALANQAPANAADLHALVLDHLRSLSAIIDGSNDDQFKLFWNETAYGVVHTPKAEESCRDVLITLMRPRLSLLGLSVEPEGHMSANKRVDIAVLGPGLKCVIEVKLAHSPDLWTASTNQLGRLYTRDPDTKGYGILLVIWFGEKSKKRATKRKPDGWVADTPAELEAALQPDTESQVHRIASVVVDVSGGR